MKASLILLCFTTALNAKQYIVETDQTNTGSIDAGSDYLTINNNNNNNNGGTITNNNNNGGGNNNNNNNNSGGSSINNNKIPDDANVIINNNENPDGATIINNNDLFGPKKPSKKGKPKKTKKYIPDIQSILPDGGNLNINLNGDKKKQRNISP